jgi:cytochrome c5
MKSNVWCVLAILGIVACSSSKSDSDDDGAPTASLCPSNSTLTYENFGKGFMNSYCVSCHSSSLSGSARQGAPSDHNFDSLEAIRETEAEHIDEEAAAGPSHTNTAMPPSGPKPSLDDRKKLGEWLACGTP